MHVPLIRTKKFGGDFAVKKDAEAKAQDQEAEAEAQQREEHWLFFTQAGLACICVRPHHQKTTLGATSA